MDLGHFWLTNGRLALRGGYEAHHARPATARNTTHEK